MSPEISLVVACADNGVIGMDGKLPWHLPNDLRHFKIKTMGAPMIMGRKTFESLPKLLPDREHIVLTRDRSWWHEGVFVAHSKEEALEQVAGDRVSVIGGAEIYREFLPLASKIHLTKVHITPEGDTFFPGIEEADWIEIKPLPEPAKGKYPAHTFITLLRRAALSQD